MQRNLSAEDRLFRLVVGLALLPLAAVLDGDARMIGLLGVVPVLLAMIGWSPLYALLGVSTRADVGNDSFADAGAVLIPVRVGTSRQ